MASHDLRQPLHALGLFVAQLRGYVPSIEGRALVERIDGAVVNMTELFTALLDISKLDAGVLVPNLMEFPVAHLLDRMDATFAAVARAKGLSLRVVASSAWVRSDIILLERILQNLVSNALRYAAHGGVVVGCRRRGGLRIDARDSGPGIPRTGSAMFGEFYQLKGRARIVMPGWAWDCHRRPAAAAHDADVDAGQGLAFRHLRSTARSGRSGAPPSHPQSSLNLPAGKLALIDDDAMNLRPARLLKSWVAGSRSRHLRGALVRLAADNAAPDIIISDYHLSNGTTGYEVIARLRDSIGPSVPAFLMSGDTAPERLREASASGFALLHKPVPPMKLRLMLNRLLSDQSPVGADP